MPNSEQNRANRHKAEQCLVPFNGIHLLAPNDYTHWLFSAEKKMNNSFYSGCTLPTVVFQFQYINNTFSLHKIHIPDQSKCIAVFPSIVSDGLFSFYWTIIILFLFDFFSTFPLDEPHGSSFLKWHFIQSGSCSFFAFFRWAPLFYFAFISLLLSTIIDFSIQIFPLQMTSLSHSPSLNFSRSKKWRENLWKWGKKNVFIRSKKNVLEKIIEKHFAFKKISME